MNEKISFMLIVVRWLAGDFYPHRYTKPISSGYTIAISACIVHTAEPDTAKQSRKEVESNAVVFLPAVNPFCERQQPFR